MELLKAGLSIFTLTWLVSFWYKLDSLREKLGIRFEIGQDGFVEDRTDQGGLGSWINCPQCAVVLVALPGWFLRNLLAPVGLALLLVRWWESVRVKREWWR